MFRDRAIIFAIFAGALVMTLPTLGVRDITTSHEGRVAQTARQMAASGWPWNAASVTVPTVGWRDQPDGVKRLMPDPSLPPLSVNPWIVPVISGEIRLQKPPLPYWVTAVCFKLFGVNEWAARLVPTLMWTMLTLIIADLAAMLIHPRTAIWAAGLWISSYFCYDEFRKAMADPYVASFAITAVWAWIRGTKTRASANANPEFDSLASFRIPRAAFLVLIYLFLALGFLSKGPAVFVPFFAGMLPAWWLQRPEPRRASLVFHATGVILFLLIALPWYAVILHRVPNALQLWKYESIGGFGEKNEKPQAFWFYGPQLLLMALPWTPLWIAGIVVSLRNRWRRGFAVIWQLVIVLVFSLITQKKNAYLLPATAAQTLVAVQGMRWFFVIAKKRLRAARAHRLIGGTIAVAAFSIATAFPWYSHFQENRRSARAISLEITRKLPGSGAVMHASSLSPDAAFYLPLDWRDNLSANVQWVMLDDRRDSSSATPRAFAYLFNGRSVQSVRRLPLAASPETFRWKVYEVTLAP